MDGLSVEPARMRANIEATRGLVFAERAMLLLAPRLGKDAAGRAIAAAVHASTRGEDFVAALRTDPAVVAALAPDDLATLASPEAYLGAAEEFRRRLIDADRQ
jgi:3-carboxy-cis,cis-muconate cycloisomerase